MYEYKKRIHQWFFLRSKIKNEVQTKQVNNYSTVCCGPLSLSLSRKIPYLLFIAVLCIFIPTLDMSHSFAHTVKIHKSSLLSNCSRVYIFQLLTLAVVLLLPVPSLTFTRVGPALRRPWRLGRFRLRTRALFRTRAFAHPAASADRNTRRRAADTCTAA